MKFAILGTRGVPPRYGGFETFAGELSRRLAARGHEVIVYCRRDVGRASARPDGLKPVLHEPEPAMEEQDPFGAVAVDVENPFEVDAERGELEALLAGAAAVVRALEAALDRAREQERALRDRLARR